MKITHEDVAREIGEILPAQDFVPASSCSADGAFIRIETAIRPLAGTALGEFIVQVRPLHPLAGTHPALLAAVRRACEEVILESGGANPGAVQAARARMAIVAEDAARMEDDALDLHWIEIEQDWPTGPIVQRRCTDAGGRAVFSSVLMDAATRLRRPAERGIFRVPEPVWTADAEALDAEAATGSEAYHLMRGGILRAAARLERRGETARLIVDARGENWSSVRVGWRFGSERGVVALAPGFQPDLFSGSAILQTPFAEARRCDPVFDIAPAVLADPVLQCGRDGWRIEAEAPTGGRREVIRFAQAACVVGGLIFQVADFGSQFILNTPGVIETELRVPLPQPLRVRVSIAREKNEWRVKLKADASAPATLRAEIVGASSRRTGMRGLKDLVFPLDGKWLADEWAIQFEWMDEAGWHSHRQPFPRMEALP